MYLNEAAVDVRDGRGDLRVRVFPHLAYAVIRAMRRIDKALGSSYRGLLERGILGRVPELLQLPLQIAKHGGQRTLILRLADNVGIDRQRIRQGLLIPHT